MSWMSVRACACVNPRPAALLPPPKKKKRWTRPRKKRVGWGAPRHGAPPAVQEKKENAGGNALASSLTSSRPTGRAFSSPTPRRRRTGECDGDAGGGVPLVASTAAAGPRGAQCSSDRRTAAAALRRVGCWRWCSSRGVGMLVDCLVLGERERESTGVKERVPACVAQSLDAHTRARARGETRKVWMRGLAAPLIRFTP